MVPGGSGVAATAVGVPFVSGTNKNTSIVKYAMLLLKMDPHNTNMDDIFKYHAHPNCAKRVQHSLHFLKEEETQN